MMIERIIPWVKGKKGTDTGGLDVKVNLPGMC